MKKQFLLLSILLPVLLLSCGKGPETITVNSDPLVPNESDTAVTESPQKEAGNFVQYRFGEFDSIYSLDPLFVSNNTEMRMVNLLYQGLTGINALGNPVPAISKRWEVNRDSTRFTFHIKTDIYFHDSGVFTSGIGRKLTVNDIKYAFERMASSQVPDHAFQMFRNIRGFSAYHSEQTYVKNPAQRIINSINGIEVRNDSTILFIMNKPSGNFIRNLAHPMASIYPKESVNRGQVPIQNPVGSGRFYLVKKEQNRYILSVNKEYTGTRPELNRLDIITGLTESALLKQFQDGELDVLMQLSPSAIETVMNDEGNLNEPYRSNYELISTGSEATYNLYYNEGTERLNEVSSLLQQLQDDSVITNPNLGSLTYMNLQANDTTSSSGEADTQFTITHTSCVPELFLVNRIAGTASTAGYTTSMNASYALADDVTFTTRPYPGTQKILSWKFPVYLLIQPGISGVDFNTYDWNVDLTGLNTTGGS